MAELNYNKNLFTNVNKWKINTDGSYSYTGILVASKLNQKNGQDYKLIDAIDIDWNGTWISSLKTYVHTTSDLIYVLNALNKNENINALDSKIAKIWEQINEITSTYITYTSLYDILSSGYQKKLVPGEFISIDENSNVITTYDLASYSYLIENYTSLVDHKYLSKKLENNYFTKSQTLENIIAEVKRGIDSVIDGADSAFDTLKEISDWILEQNRYVEVSKDEVVNGLLDPENEDQFFYFDEETQKYIEITSIEEVETLLAANPSIKFFRLENYLTDIKDLIDEVDKLQATVGDKQFNSEYGTYTYTGILLDIYKLYLEDKYIHSSVENIRNVANSASYTANIAYNTAYTAYITANTAYDTANIAYDLSYETSNIANIAYTVAKKASDDVGVPTKKGQGYVEIIFDEIETYKNAGYIIYFDNFGNIEEAREPYHEDYQYYIYDETIEGTGLTKRVEDAETTANLATEKANTAINLANRSLYNLHVNNNKSSYVKLSLTPDKYDGPSRILHIESYTAIVDPNTGEIINDGLTTVSTVYDIYSYASSWQILDNSNINN
jgi:hypothetical protein